MNNYERWNELPYAGESTPPMNAETPKAWSWRTYFIRLDREEDQFTDLEGKPIHLHVRHPNTINWDDQLNKVHRALSRLTSKERDIARYWATGPASKQWIPIVDKLIDTYGVEAPRSSRILSCLFASMNDAFVATWYLKYKWLVARPNQLDQDLVTIVCTPRHPSYPSGHAAVAGVAETVLSYFFPGERRKLKRLAEECAKSRLYAGVHFPIDNDEGLKLGRQIGHIAIQNIEQDRDNENETIDTPYRAYRNADLVPPPYEQPLPFDFDDHCDSLVEGDTSEHPYNSTVPKPKLYY
ncbi:vanadium chloroperoxidase [Pontibacillus halophilus JSM 076056 = DSM 19796]|uniref:Vanadium chloroperoxidase n=1 Tax=Pontibacillus halophilus JSM 076056 = DSM 19796 TaxID=1385510 RepID=A0A0A5GN23_9BACI|nr:vanadium-dependent haloperoxidase [Pontibacillus halophilus]KGX92535.1 vanadium chloroperoxidase [Pontibacillus halophilus JSM 076056 = DSM 19796]